MEDTWAIRVYQFLSQLAFGFFNKMRILFCLHVVCINLKSNSCVGYGWVTGLSGKTITSQCFPLGWRSSLVGLNSWFPGSGPPVGTAIDSRHPGKVRPSTEPTSWKCWETRKRLMGTHMSRYSVAPLMTFCQKVKAMYGLLACLWDHLLLDCKRSQRSRLSSLSVLTVQLCGSGRGNRRWARRPRSLDVVL